MKNIKSYIGLVTVAIVSLSSCKNDLDVLAPGEEKVSVYGILNPNESVQKIRINKVYLTSGDAISAGQDANQINYGPGELQVTLQRFNVGSNTPTLTTVGNTTRKEIVLTETVVVTSDGNFNANQRIWQTTDKLYNSGEYRLLIKNLNSGKEFSSSNTMIDSVRSYQSKPFIHNIPNYPGHGQYVTTGSFPTPESGYIDYSNLVATQKIRFLSIPNAKLYNVILRFHYIDSLIAGGTNPGYVDFNFPTQKSPSLKGGEPMEVSFLANEFYTNIGTEMAKKPSVSVKNRRSFYLEYIIKAGSETLNTFLQVNQPSNTIAQDKPYYTNINGGVGIFASASRSTITHDMWNDFIDKIACHPSTNPFGFCNGSGVKTTVCP
ncbi:MAG: hypothetical protein JNM51_15500 [Bacteroidia bacterium]|nr:hypothetical protein [Bacteroidia bacterium]